MTTRSVGNAAERRAAELLEQLGFRIIERNYSCRQGEIDLVCEEGDTLCFVEVRMRASTEHGDPLETITHAKRGRIVRAAKHYLFARAIAERACRFDVVTIVGEEQPVLLRDAFQVS